MLYKVSRSRNRAHCMHHDPMGTRVHRKPKQQGGIKFSIDIVGILSIILVFLVDPSALLCPQ